MPTVGKDNHIIVKIQKLLFLSILCAVLCDPLCLNALK